MLFVVAAAVYLFIRSYGRRNDVQKEDMTVEDMVRCRQCGVHLPRSEGIKVGEDFFCSLEHRDAAKK